MTRKKIKKIFKESFVYAGLSHLLFLASNKKFYFFSKNCVEKIQV